MLNVNLNRIIRIIDVLFYIVCNKEMVRNNKILPIFSTHFFDIGKYVAIFDAEFEYWLGSEFLKKGLMELGTILIEIINCSFLLLFALL